MLVNMPIISAGGSAIKEKINITQSKTGSNIYSQTFDLGKVIDPASCVIEKLVATTSTGEKIDLDGYTLNGSTIVVSFYRTVTGVVTLNCTIIVLIDGAYKKIQRGYLRISNRYSKDTNISISSVDVGKSIILENNDLTASGKGSGYGISATYNSLYFYSNTALRLDIYSTSADANNENYNTGHVLWNVIEFE